jgi:DNA-binding transcriptional LysR family regulator
MELRQLEYFVAVVEEANFTRAAARVHVAQPGVSAQVRRLEREVGQDLLDRSGRTVKVTEVGAAVLPYARAALAAVAGVRLAVDELTGLLRGRVTIGAVTSIPFDQVSLPGLLSSFHADHPAVDVSLSIATTDELIDGLRSGELDMAFIGLGMDAPRGLATRVMLREPLVAVVRPADPLAGQTTITLRALAGHPLICLPKGTGLRSYIDSAFHDAALRPHVSFEAGDPPLVAQLAAEGLGVGVVPSSVADARPETLHTIAITGPRLEARIALAWRDERPISPAARELIARVNEAVAP